MTGPLYSREAMDRWRRQMEREGARLMGRYFTPRPILRSDDDPGPQLRFEDYYPGVTFDGIYRDYEMPASHPTDCDLCSNAIEVGDPIWVRPPYQVYHQACGVHVRLKENRADLR